MATPTIVDALDGTTYTSTSLTVGELKEEYEREHGVPADTQTIWACSTGEELNNDTTLVNEDKVQLMIDCQIVTVYVDDNTYMIKCDHNSTIEDVRQALEMQHGIKDVTFALDAAEYDTNAIITMNALVAKERPAHEYLERPLRMVCIGFGDTQELSSTGRFRSCKSFIDLGATKLVVQTPWLRSARGIRRLPTEVHHMIDVHLDGYDGSNPEVTALYNCLNTIQNRLLDECCNTYYTRYLDRNWRHPQRVVGHNNNIQRTVCTLAMCPILHFPQRLHTGRQAPPSVLLKIPQQSGHWNCHVRNDDTGDNVTGDLSEAMNRPLSVRAVIQCTELLCGAGRWGTTWVVRALEYRMVDPLTEDQQPAAVD